MERFFTVTGHSIYDSDFTPSRRTDYEFLISFARWEDNRERHENFLSWYLSWDFARDGRPYHLFRDETCARALATMFLRDRTVRLNDDNVEYAIGKDAPQRPPEFQDAGHRLWVIKEVETDIYTESNAGWDLYDRCRYSKLPVDEAKDLIRDKFAGKLYSWDEVLHYFRKHGGRHTKLYLRVD